MDLALIRYATNKPKSKCYIKAICSGRNLYYTPNQPKSQKSNDNMVLIFCYFINISKILQSVFGKKNVSLINPYIRLYLRHMLSSINQ